MVNYKITNNVLSKVQGGHLPSYIGISAKLGSWMIHIQCIFYIFIFLMCKHLFSINTLGNLASLITLTYILTKLCPLLPIMPFCFSTSQFDEDMANWYFTVITTQHVHTDIITEELLSIHLSWIYTFCIITMSKYLFYISELYSHHYFRLNILVPMAGPLQHSMIFIGRLVVCTHNYNVTCLWSKWLLIPLIFIWLSCVPFAFVWKYWLGYYQSQSVTML